MNAESVLEHTWRGKCPAGTAIQLVADRAHTAWPLLTCIKVSWKVTRALYQFTLSWSQRPVGSVEYWWYIESWFHPGGSFVELSKDFPDNIISSLRELCSGRVIPDKTELALEFVCRDFFKMIFIDFLWCPWICPCLDLIDYFLPHGMLACI